MRGAAWLAFGLGLLVAASAAAAEPTSCGAPDELAAVVSGQLPRTAQRIAAKEPLTVVVLGSASSAGAGVAAGAQAYPARLAAELAARWPTTPVRVIVKARAGRTARQMVDAIPAEVWPEAPDLTIWEIGGADVARSTDLDEFAEALDDGLAALRRRGGDALLMGPQYAPHLAILANADAYDEYSGWAAETAGAPRVRRYELMRHWHEDGQIDLSAEDRPAQAQAAAHVHACLARALAEVIIEAARPAD